MDLVFLLSLLVFHEGRGEPVKCQKATLEVVYNRVKHPSFPNTVHAVVHQRNAFSWTRNRFNFKKPQKEAESWKKSNEVVRDFLSNKTDYSKGAVYFNTKSMGVRYKTKANGGKPLLTCGGDRKSVV